MVGMRDLAEADHSRAEGTELRAEADHWKARALQLEKRLSDMTSQLHQLEHGMVRQQLTLMGELDRARADIAALHASLSWHITAPIRYLKIGLCRTRNGLRRRLAGRGT